jgi:glucose/arabinose dehydrogenase
VAELLLGDRETVSMTSAIHRRGRNFRPSAARHFSAYVVVVALSVALLASNAALAQRSASKPLVRLVEVVKADRPIGFALHPDGVVYVQEQAGRLRPITLSSLGPIALDVSDDISAGGERGLLGAAFSPDGATLYTDVTNGDGDTEIAAWPFADGEADASARRLLLTIEQPFSNHNGGQLWVSADGVLWIGMGDGGAGGDPQNYGQRTDSLLGKILRIDPRATSDQPYGIPPGNIAREGVRPEIWAIGVRNPWRFSIDTTTRTIWIADVGQNAWEEINAVPVSAQAPNFGWKQREGTKAYEGGKRPTNNVEPVHAYSHGRGCSVTGGVVVRGASLPTLTGAYVFSDYCRGDLRALVKSGSGWRETALGATVASPTAFVSEASGSVLVASAEGGIFRLAPVR